jgi:hypothetical protein
MNGNHYIKTTHYPQVQSFLDALQALVLEHQMDVTKDPVTGECTLTPYVGPPPVFRSAWVSLSTELVERLEQESIRDHVTCQGGF